jgi:NADH-quinone oxidoreductase subunit I
MKHSYRQIIPGLKSLFTGMAITLKEFFKPTVTLHYPWEAEKMKPRFRGHIELVRDESTGKPICFACKLCERACPSDCISVDGVKKEGDKKKSVTEFKLDFTKCSLCRSCIEACPSGAIRFSKTYNEVTFNREEFIMDLFARLEAESKNRPEPQPPA